MNMNKFSNLLKNRPKGNKMIKSRLNGGKLKLR